VKKEDDMPFNVAVAKDKKTGQERVFRTSCTSIEELVASLEQSRKNGFEEEVAVDFLSFESRMAVVLEDLCEFGSTETELMAILVSVRNAAR
jgi:hypothetical protein